MTSTVTEVTVTTLRSTTYDTLSTTVGVAVVLVLLVLLLQKEVARIAGGDRANAWVHAFDLALLPLLLTFVLIVGARLGELLA